MNTNTHFWSHLAQFFSEWEMFQTKVVKKIKTHILCSITFFENRAVYEIMWKSTVERGRPQMTTWRMRIACWIPKATNTHSEYVILIDLPLQLLHESASMLPTSSLPVLLQRKTNQMHIRYSLISQSIFYVFRVLHVNHQEICCGNSVLTVLSLIFSYRLINTVSIHHTPHTWTYINPLNMKRRLLYLKTQFVPCCCAMY